MQRRGAVLTQVAAVAVLGAFSSCAHEERLALEAPHGELASDAGALSDVAPEPFQYVVADPLPSRGVPFVLTPLGKNGNGVILDGLRLISGAGHPHFARDTAEPALVGVARMPGSMGGAFLFWNDRSLFTSEAFDGTLKPLAAMPEGIASVSFAPKAILVRGSNGERWSIDPKSGGPASANPPGVVDVAALADGRAAAIGEFGAAMISVDRGEHWTDVTAQLSAPATAVLLVDDALWLTPATGHALRVDLGGVLTAFDKAPEVKPLLLRPKDLRWGATEAPIRRAIRLGLPADETTALVVSEGNLVKVSLATGELLSVAPGRLPPDATCEAMRAQDDVVVACTRPNGAPSFVASHVFGEKAPLIEQTFMASGSFYGSDDGSLAFGGPCSRAKASRLVVCVRSATGSWQEYDLENSDGGAPIDIGRWVPRADGGAFGILTAPSVGTIDARTGEIHRWNLDSVPQTARNFPEFRARHSSDRDALRIIDRVWTVTAQGTLRGWMESGVAEVGREGQIAVAAFGFERQAPSGAYALARTKDGRVWQTLDRGVAWTEVAAPLTTKNEKYAEPRLCSPVGCDLGGWYRIGWVPTAPQANATPAIASSAPLLSPGVMPHVVCKVTGEIRSSAALRTAEGAEELGLGANRLSSSTDKTSYELVRTLFARVPLNPPHSVDASPTREEASPRALFHGYATSMNGDRLVVSGPVKEVSALRRPVMFVAPFDPLGTVKKTSFGVGEILSAARAIGLAPSDVLGDDPTTVSGITPLLEVDPAAPGGLAFFGANGLIGVLRSAPQARARVALRVRKTDDSMPVSAVALGAGDDVAMLELDPDGGEHVVKWTTSGVSDFFDVPPPGSAELYPANPDALAVGPRGELGILRTPSGGSPAASGDPALLMIAGAPAIPLASWSTLLPADDPACRAEAGGWRAIVQTVRPWVTLTGGGLRAEEDAPSFARVRWSATRVCLEALEVRVADMKAIGRETSSDRATTASLRDVESWVIARFTGTASATRVGVSPGTEVRQSLECAVAR